MNGHPDAVDPLACGHRHGHDHLEADGSITGPDDSGEDLATSNLTDLRRARQRARATIRGLTEVIINALPERFQNVLDQPDGPRQINALVSRTAAEHIRRELLDWLEDRKRVTMSRAARAAFDTMQNALPDSVEDDDLVSAPMFTNGDRDLLSTLQNIDVGLLTGTRSAQEAGATTDALAQELGDDVTRQLRLGVSRDEPVASDDPDQMDLRTRVDMVLNGPDYDRSKKQEAGVTGQSKRTKAELIAHDSIQDAYNAQARRRYLQNGFRYVVYDATLDTRTTQLCRRMDGEVIDIVENPHLLPPNHPYCRSGHRPVLEPPSEPVTEQDIADEYLQDIWSTESYRPTVQDDSAFQPTALTQELDLAT